MVHGVSYKTALLRGVVLTVISLVQDKDWENAVQFLPVSDSKKLEKKKGPGKAGAVIGVVILLAVIALMTGLLVWHFHCE